MGWACDLLWPTEHNDVPVLSPDPTELCMFPLLFPYLTKIGQGSPARGMRDTAGFPAKTWGYTYIKKFLFYSSEILIELGILYFICTGERRYYSVSVSERLNVYESPAKISTSVCPTHGWPQVRKWAQTRSAEMPLDSWAKNKFLPVHDTEVWRLFIMW